MKPEAAFIRIIAIGMCGLTASAIAATYPVDDRATVPYGSTAKMDWDRALPARRISAGLSGSLAVQVRLDVRPWRNRTGRIFLRLQNATVNAISAAWTTEGRLLPGSVQTGERALVYAGPIRVDAIEDVMTVAVHGDGRRLIRDEVANFSFEIDVN